MNEPEKPLTLAERQIRRLQSLRSQNPSEPSPETDPVETKAEISAVEPKLKRLKFRLSLPPRPRIHQPRPIEGKTKAVRLTFHQLKVLEKLLSHNKHLRRSPILRLALNRMLNLPMTPEEKELESILQETLRHLKGR